MGGVVGSDAPPHQEGPWDFRVEFACSPRVPWFSPGTLASPHSGPDCTPMTDPVRFYWWCLHFHWCCHVSKEKNENAAWLTWFSYPLLYPFLVLFPFFHFHRDSKMNSRGLLCPACDTDTCTLCAAGLSVVSRAPQWDLRAPTAIAVIRTAAVARWQAFQFCILLDMWWSCCKASSAQVNLNKHYCIITTTRRCSERGSYSRQPKIVSLTLSLIVFCFQEILNVSSGVKYIIMAFNCQQFAHLWWS